MMMGRCCPVASWRSGLSSNLFSPLQLGHTWVRDLQVLRNDLMVMLPRLDGKEVGSEPLQNSEGARPDGSACEQA